VKGRTVDVRLSTMPIQHGESVVMRLLDQAGGMLDLDQLGMPSDVLARFRHSIHKPHGMVSVTGPTGSGKTTTLYGAPERTQRARGEDHHRRSPVEYDLPRVSQVQVKPKIGLDFATVLRTALRQDPDIVLVGEIRDNETAGIALRHGTPPGAIRAGLGGRPARGIGGRRALSARRRLPTLQQHQLPRPHRRV